MNNLVMSVITDEISKVDEEMNNRSSLSNEDDHYYADYSEDYLEGDE